VVILTKIKSLFNPSMYQGWGTTRKYFEGWYYKAVNAAATKAFAFIPGIARDEKGECHAFIQVLDGIRQRSEYYSFEASSFNPSDKKFEISIGSNFFSADSIILDLPAYKGKLNFSEIINWPGRWYSPGIMGPYTFAPFMQCNHGIVSMDHSISGSLEIEDDEIDFTGGRGYTEKDWGHSFPSAYIWMQSNYFENPGISFKASIATIPWITGTFNGFIAGLWYKDRLYRYTEYNGSRLSKLIFTGKNVELEFLNRESILSVSAPFSHTTSLASPVRGLMKGRIEESMTSVITLSLADRRSGDVLFKGEGRIASIEVSGNTKTLLPSD
jgi:tocopherol cyclase